MIAAWVTYCVLVSVLLGAAAWVAEGALRAQGWAGRWPWAVALAGSIGLPLGAWLRPVAASEPASMSVLPMPGAYVMESIPVLALESASGRLSLETALLLAWATATVALLLYLAVSALRIRAEGRGWRRGEVDGVAVLVSEATGPAALGLFRGRVVLPEWALSLDEGLRRLLVLHEAEHVRAKDPQLAVAGLVTCALMPWNPVLWWQLSRLRLAIEMDCDARVLGRAGDRARYGSLLLEVGQRRARLAVGLAESGSMLERRIRMITKTTTGRRTVRALGLGALSALVLAVACETPPPMGLGAVESRPLQAEEALSAVSDFPCEPVLYLDGELVDRNVLNTTRPEDIETVDVLRGDLSLRANQVVLEPAERDPRLEPDPACGVILILTRGASLEAQERTRRLKEDLVAERASRRGDEAARDPADGPSFTPMTVRPQLRNVREVQQALMRHYPPLLRDAGIGGEALIWFFIDEDGAVRDTRVNRSSGHEALDQAALAVASVMEFTPAYNRDVRVPVWIAMPIRFEVTPAPAPAPAPASASPEPDVSARQPTGQPLGQSTRPDAAEAAPSGEGPVFTPMTLQPRLQNPERVAQAIARHHPPLLRNAGIGGTARVWVHIDAQGRVQRAQLAGSSGYDALDQAALRVAEVMRFTGARNRDELVPVWIALPVTFPSGSEESA
jgi:TonB family protein